MKRTKKALGAAMCLAGIVCGAAGFSACGEHEHTYSADWANDATSHWHDCSGCDEKGSLENHTYGEWKVITAATEQKAGEEQRVCTVCDYTESRDIAKLKPADDKDKDNNGDDEKESAKHEHDWGDGWTVTEANKPDATTEGKATRTCINTDCTAEIKDKEYTLPVLTSGDYTVTDNTATIETTGTATYTYNKNGVNVSFTTESPILESRIYTITVKNSKDEPLQDVTVKLGNYTAKTDAQGIASVKAEKQDYTVALEDAPYTAADRVLYDNLATVSDESPDATVWFAEAAPSSGGSSETSPKVITEDGVYYLTLSAREDPEIAGRYQIREFYIAAKAEVGAASINVEVINDNTVIGIMDAGYDMLEDKGAYYDIVKERGEQTVFTVTSNETEITADYRFTVFFKIKKSLPPEAGCKERPIRATEGDNVKTVTDSNEKVYFRLDYDTFGDYVLASFGENVTLYDLGLRVSGDGVQVETGCTLNIPEFGYRYAYATSASDECKINLERTVLEGMKGRPFTANTDGSDNTVKFDISAGVLEQWYKIEVSEGGNYILKTNNMNSYLTAYGDINGTEFIVKSGMGTSLPLALTANTPVYVKAESHINLTYAFTCAPATEEDLGTNPQQPMTLVSGDYNVNSTSDAEGKNSYYVFTAEENTKLTISYSGGGTFMLTIFNNAEFDSANGGQIAFVSSWTNAYTRYLYKGETYYFSTNARNAGGNTFTFNPVVLESHDYEITFTMPDETLVSEAMTVKLMKGDEEVASGTLSEGKVTFTDVSPDNFTLVISGGMPAGYGCYPYDLVVSINDDEKTEKTVKLTQFVDFSVTVKLPATAESAPVEGAEVTLYNGYQGELTAVTTDSEGKATISALPPVNERGQQTFYYIKVTLPAGTDADYYYASSYATVSTTNNECEIALTQKYELVIKVVLPDGDNTPVADKKVTVTYTADKTYEGTTDNDGVVRIKIPATSTSGWSAAVELGDLAEQYYSGSISLSSYQNGVEKVLTLKEYKNYTLTLKSDGAPLGAGVEVTLTKSNVTWTQTTDADGTVQFSKLEAGNYTITLSGSYITFDTIKSSSAETLDINCYYVDNNLTNGMYMDDAMLSESSLALGKTPVYIRIKSYTDYAFFKFTPEEAGTYTITVSDITSTGANIDRVWLNGNTTNILSGENAVISKDETDKSGSGYTKFTVTLQDGEFIIFKLVNNPELTGSQSKYACIEITKVED